MPRTCRNATVAHRVGDDVEKARPFVAVNSDAAAVCVNSFDGGIRRQAIEFDVDARFVETLRGCAVRIQDLVAELVKAQATTLGVAVVSVEGVNDDAHVAVNEQSLVTLCCETLSRLIEQLNAVAFDLRGDCVLEIFEWQRERVEFRAAGTEVEMDVVHLIDCADYVADVKARPAFDAHTLRLTLAVSHEREVRFVEQFVLFVTTDLHVNVSHHADANAFAEIAVAPIAQYARDLLIVNRAHERAVCALHVYAAVQVIAALAVVTAAHLSHRRDDFMRALLRVNRPRQRIDAENQRTQARQRLVVLN